MNVLVLCEYSARVRDAFRLLGHDAWSCDLLDTDGDKRFHHKGDLFELMQKNIINIKEWDLIIAHPPCTFLTGAAEWAFDENPMIQGKPRNIKPGTLIGKKRHIAREEALSFVKRLWNLPVDKICIENPVGVITKRLPEMGKPQYIQQHWFGEDASKKTGLWLKGLPGLIPTNNIDGRMVCCDNVITDKYSCPDCCGDKKPVYRWGNQTNSGQNKLPPSEYRWKIRSTTPKGIANAMAEQWG